MIRITGLDIETTGLEQSSGDRIIEVAMIHYNEHGRETGAFVKRIDPQRPISADAQAVHGISYSMLAGCETWPTVAPQVAAELKGTNLIVIHNANFDAPFLAGELLRVGLTPPVGSVYCTMENGRFATFDGKNPTLAELCYALGVEYEPSKAHAAEYDVRCMMECYFIGARRKFFQLP